MGLMTNIWNRFNGGIVQNPILIPNGAVGAPGLAFTNDPDTGIYMPAAGYLNFSAAGALVGVAINDGGITGWLINKLIFGTGTFDLVLERDAANTLALKNGNEQQQFNIYSGNGGYGLIKSKQELVTTTAAATALTAADFIPDGAVPLAISTYVQTAITTGGLTGYAIGDGADADRWGAIVGHVVGTNSNNSNWVATTIQSFVAAQAITLTASGANFPAGGKVRVCMTYISNIAATS